MTTGGHCSADKVLWALMSPRWKPSLRRRIEHAVRLAYCSGSPDGERSLTATAWAARGTIP